MARRQKELDDLTPDPDRYEVLSADQVGPHLVMMVKYTSCIKCEYEGKKVMVFLDTSYKDVIYWRRIDPHFRAHPPVPPNGTHPKESPPPAARYPATSEGWLDALSYAQSKAAR